MTTKRRWILASGLVVLVALLAWAMMPPSEQPFFDYVAERKAAGLPTTYDELTGPAPSDAENGAADLAAANKSILETHGPSASWSGSPFDEKLVMEDDQDGPTAAQIAPLRPIVAKMRPDLDRLSAALAKPRLWFAAKLDSQGMRWMDHLTVVQNAQRILTMPATAEDDPSRRLAACRDLLVLSRRIERVSLIDGMVAMAVATSAAAALRRGVESGALGAVESRAACDGLLRRSWLDEMQRSFRVESVGIVETYRAILDGRAVSMGSRPDVSGWARTKHRVERIADRLRGGGGDGVLWGDVEPHMARSIVKACREWDAVGVEDPKAAVDRGAEVRAGKGTVASVVVRMTRSVLRAEAQCRLARVGLAVAEHRAKHGEFPASLDELKPAFPDGVPLDPMTDAPFVYERTAAGARIAAAGPRYVEPPLTDAARHAQGFVWVLTRR